MQAIVAALNLAEQKISAEETLEKESLLLSSELENMATFLREQLKK
jgi:hypothetical protein